MKLRQTRAVIVGLASTALAVGLVSAPAQAAPPQGDKAPRQSAKKHDDLPNPLGDKLRETRKQAIEAVINGDATVTTNAKGERVIKMPGKASTSKAGKAQKARDKYVTWPVQREEDIFTILADFGTQTKQATGGTAGPVHNQIPKPDRTWDGNATDDNSTYWIKDFNRQHYLDMMFGQGESFRDFYAKQSNGRFLAKGDVSDWVKVPYNEAAYGSNTQADAAGYWPFIQDTVTAWYDAQKASGKTDAEIADYVKQFDKVDRYDYDGDGVYNEPDGYIDHFQAIHAGEGEEAGGGAQGEDAIWSHRWYAFPGTSTGPAGNKAGGTQIGNTGIWVGDYTTEPENGGLGVFTHEFGHDLGLPDLYDTAGGDNGTGFWTLMSGGSWLNHGTDSIGTTPGYMGAWEKLQLGWLDYQQVDYPFNRDVKVGPADRDSATLPQALLVNLPKKTVVTKYNTPHSGSNEWWGGAADNLASTLTRTIDLTGKTSASVSAWLQYNIEDGYDALTVQASNDGGATWTDLESITGPVDNAGLTPWAQKTWDLSSMAGGPVQFRFRYTTDGGVHFDGAFIDDITTTVDGVATLDDVESGTNGWTAAGGFVRTSGTTSEQVSHYYLAENRVYSGYDATLRTGPYNFGWSNTKPDWVERFPYQNGLLVWYVDGQYSDNNTSAHPGHGQVLPVDARPAPVKFPAGQLLGNRRQPWDATFGQERTDRVTFHRNGVATTVAPQKAIPTFTDLDVNKYWTADNPWSSVKVAGLGTSITVAQTSNKAQDMLLKVRFAQP